MIDRREAIKGLFSAPMLIAGVDKRAVEVVDGPKKRTLLVFRATTRLPFEAANTVCGQLRKWLDDSGVKCPAILLPYEIELDVHEVDR